MDPHPSSPKHCVHIAYEGGKWLDQKIDYEALSLKLLKEVCSQTNHPSGEVSILMTDNARVQILNRDYRHKDAPTNVLSFESGFLRSSYLPQDHPLFLGDIALAFETLEQEASAAGISFENHLSHLLVHGMLHLLAYDHLDDDQAKTMEALEISVLSKFNIPNPYELKEFHEDL